MQTVSAPFTTAAGAVVRLPVPKFEVQWDGANWTDETTNVMAFRLAQQIEIPGIDLTPLGTTDAGTVTLRNTAYRYSAWHSGGDTAVRTYLSGDWGVTGIKARLSMGFWVDTDTDGDYDEVQYCRVFTGYLYNITEAPQAKTVTLSLRDNAWLLYQKRLSTALYANYRLDTLLYTMADAGGWDVANDWTADTSPFTVPAAWLDDDAALQEMQQAAASVAGRLWCDANGELRYEEASHWLGHSSVSWHFDGGDLMELPPVLNPESLASSVIVEYASRVSGASRVLYTLDEVRTIRPGATATIDIRLTQPAVTVFPLLADSDYWFDNGAGLPMNSKITIGTVSYYAQRVSIPITNTHATMPAVLRFLSVRGRPIEGGPQEEVETVIDASPIVPRVRSVRGNFYLQSRTQAAYLSALLAGRHDSLIPLWHIRSAPGVPQLELGDRVGVYDGRAVSAEREGFVLSIESRFAVPASGTATEPVFAQDIRVMDATPLFVSATYFQIGVSALGAGVAWY